MKSLNSWPSRLTFLVLSLTFLSCTNGGVSVLSGKRSASRNGDPFTSALKISSAAITSDVARLFIDLSESLNSPEELCSGSSGLTPCQCQFEWDQIYEASGNASPEVFTRKVMTSVTTVQSGLIECELPAVYGTELPAGTPMRVSVAPAPGNSHEFEIPAYQISAEGSSSEGSFQDFEGRSFHDIFHYSCYEHFKRGLGITNLRTDVNGTDGNGTARTKSILLANRFCASSGGVADNRQGCEGSPAPDYSSQSYYYNLFIRASDKGSINIENNRFKCPLVKEPISGLSLVGASNSVYPLDSNFALALSPSGTYPVPVEAFSKLGIDGDPATASSSCYGQGSTAGDSNSLVKSCLGFAAKPRTDGTCPLLKDASGESLPTYRLRRYVALYPLQFDTTGKAVTGPQGVDTIYVLDRPVAGSPDPDRPYTMRGPKPCPFAYFDHAEVTGGGGPRYLATSDPQWTGKNVDGIQLPNQDVAGLSCAATIGVLNQDKDAWTLATLGVVDTDGGANFSARPANDPLRNLYIRPVQAWAPHYVEDESFAACAPPSSNFIDPPLHFSKDTEGNVAWCSMSYPTQNPNVAALTRPTSAGSGQLYPVTPFTSPTVKNSRSPQCTATSITESIPAGYPMSGPAYHDGANATTCDRTVQNSNLTWKRFPLSAPPSAIESAIIDPKQAGSYRCSLTYDGTSGEKASQGRTPSGGCCGATVQMATTTGRTGNLSAHLEPSTNPEIQCQTPNY